MKLLVIGGNSAVGMALQQLLAERNVEHRLLAADDLDLLQKMEVAKAVSRYSPTQIINVASYSNLELAEKDSDAARLCDEQNSLVPAVLAEVCAHLSLPLIQHSSSFVFDGQKVHPYSEEDPANPVCRYGRSKWSGERAIRDVLPNHIILRTDWVFSQEDEGFFRKHIHNCLAQRGRLEILNHRFSPTPAADVARVLLSIAQQLDCSADVWGTYHYCAQQPLTQEAFVEQCLQEAGKYDPELAALLPALQITRLPVRLPYIANSVLNVQKLFETFGIKARSRNSCLSTLLRALYCQPPVPKPVSTTSMPADTDGMGAENAGLADKAVVVRARKTRNARRPSRKAATQKAK